MESLVSPGGKRAVFWFVVIALAWGAVFLAVMLSSTDGALSMPVDDSYIFFQYAKRLADGAPWSYQAGDPATAGATSLLSVGLDAVGYLIGFRGAAVSIFALLTGVICLAWSAHSAWLLARRFCPGAPWLPPALLLTTGPVLWAMYSGMDFPWLCALALAVLAAWPAAGRPFSTKFFILAFALGWTRPDAVFLILPLVLMGMVRSRTILWVLPLAGALLPFLLQYWATGSLQSASMDVKSVLGRPGLTWSTWLSQAAGHWVYVIKGVLGGAALGDPAELAANNRSAAGLYLLPLALPLLLLGLAPSAWMEGKTRRPGPFMLVGAWILLLLGAQLATVPTHWHWNRYLINLYPFVLLGVSAGIEFVGRGIELLRGELPRGDGVRMAAATAIFLSLPSSVYFVLAYGKNCADIRFQHIQLAERLNQADFVQAETILGVHDVGALAYFGEYRVLDLEGLASPIFRKASRLQGPGVWEALESMSPNARPDYLAVYDHWFGPEFLSPHKLIYSQRQFSPSIAAGNPLNLYACDWSLAGSGADPSDSALVAGLAGAALVAEIDVADLSSEQEAGYRHHVLDSVYDSRLDQRGTAIDGGRMISGGESFVVRGLNSGSARLVLRSHAPFRLRVRIDGREQPLFISPPPRPGAWVESALDFDPGGRSEVRIEIASDDPHHAAYGSYHYWVYQRP